MSDKSYKVEAVLTAKDSGFTSGFKNAEKAVTGLSSHVEKTGSLFKSVLGANIVSAGLMAGLNAIKSSIGGIVSSAANAGAKLEQSFGGLETLYGSAAGEAKKYAAEAAKAGISANDFAEQAVSFGASLKQSLGGDATAAAKAANMAIMDLADNSAKMGTDVELLQQTYQSLARGNYQMLDNLKLGRKPIAEYKPSENGETLSLVA